MCRALAGVFRRAVCNSARLACWFFVLVTLAASARAEERQTRGPGGVDLAVLRRHGRRWLLAVGISRYKSAAIPPLRFAAKDAEAIAEFLRKPEGGGVAPSRMRLLINERATSTNLLDALGGFLGQSKPEDTVIIFISCHGAPDPKNPRELYMLTYEADPQAMAATAVPMTDLESVLLDYVPAGRKIVIADMCHSGAIRLRDEKSLGQGEANPIHQRWKNMATGKKGFAVLTASAAGERSIDSAERQHGLFTFYLLQALQGWADNPTQRDGVITLGEAYHYLRPRVIRESQNRQHPVADGSLPFDFPFAIATRRLNPPPTIQWETPRPGPTQRSVVTVQATVTDDSPPGVALSRNSVLLLHVAPNKTSTAPGVTRATRTDGTHECRLILLVDLEQGINRLVLRATDGEQEVSNAVEVKWIPPRNTAPSLPAASVRIRRERHGTDKRWMVFVPAGPFVMGSRHSPTEAPIHPVNLPAFWIDETEVTNVDFARFAQTTGYQARGDWRRYARHGKEGFPVRNVTWDDARAYAKWAGKRLPTEAQWEKAARGLKPNDYPWGQGWEGVRARGALRFADGPMRVGLYPQGRSLFGALDMCGNVAEWTSSPMRPYPYTKEKEPAAGDEVERVVRGGYWFASPPMLRCTYRLRMPPNRACSFIGFRCAKDAQ